MVTSVRACFAGITNFAFVFSSSRSHERKRAWYLQCVGHRYLQKLYIGIYPAVGFFYASTHSN